jgi:formylglycine-generating enzyme required for sulfatase activity
MVVVPAGTFKMGDIQGKGSDYEKPVHTVTIAKPFAIGRYPITFDEYDRFASAKGRPSPNDQGWGRGRQPVISVSWEDANAYAKWLSEQTGKRYRLPTEAEWEYAARAGTETSYWWGNELIKGMANCDGCGSQSDNKQTAPVGSFKSNPFGLYDRAGNVWEWVQDCYHENYVGAPLDGTAWEPKDPTQCGRRVMRGGSWNNAPEFLRASGRSWYFPGGRFNYVGFRLAQDLE